MCVCARALSHSVVSDSLWPHGLQHTRLLCPWDFSGKTTEVGCHFLLLGSQPRDQTHVSWSGRQILYHWATNWYILGATNWCYLFTCVFHLIPSEILPKRIIIPMRNRERLSHLSEVTYLINGDQIYGHRSKFFHQCPYSSLINSPLIWLLILMFAYTLIPTKTFARIISTLKENVSVCVHALVFSLCFCVLLNQRLMQDKTEKSKTNFIN